VSAQPAHLGLRIFLPFAGGYFLSYLLRAVNAVIAPELQQELTLSAANLGLLTATYLLAFGAFQIPLGMLLDRYGPRRIQSALLVIAAIGTALFAVGHSLTELAFARGLIGLGVSACLMASLKSFMQWFPLERQAALAGAIMATGALGALSASVPLEWVLPSLGWRGVFVVLTIALLLISVITFLSVPERAVDASALSFTSQWQGVVQIVSSRQFWRFAPLMGLFSGSFMALLGLWAVPWLMSVNGATRGVAAEHLFALGLGMLVCYLGIAALTTRLTRRGMRPAVQLAFSAALTLAFEGLIILGVTPTLVLWAGYGLFVSASSLCYTTLAAYFPVALSARVTTAVNLSAFAGAFGLQWGIGLVVDSLSAAGWAPPSAYRAAFSLMFVLQAIAYAWYLLEGRRDKTQP